MEQDNGVKLFDPNGDVKEGVVGLHTYTLPSGAKVTTTAVMTRGHSKQIRARQKDGDPEDVSIAMDAILMTFLLDPDTRWNYIDQKTGKLAKITASTIDQRPAEDMDALAWDLFSFHFPEFVEQMQTDLLGNGSNLLNKLEEAQKHPTAENQKEAINLALAELRSLGSADPNDGEQSSLPETDLDSTETEDKP